MADVLIEGKIVDGSTNDPIKGVSIDVNDLTEDKIYYPTPLITKTNKKGEYSFILIYPDTQPPKQSDISINITKPRYGSKKLNIFKGNGEIILNPSIISLNSTQTDLTVDKLLLSTLSQNELLTLTSSNKDAGYFAKKRLSDSISKVKNDLTGKVLDMLSEYGITDVQSLIDNPQSLQERLQTMVCIPQDQADDIIARKNKLVKILNNQLTIIETTTKYLGITDGTLKALKIVLNNLVLLSVPTAVLGVGVPISVITAVQRGIKKIEDTIDKITPLTTELLSILIVLQLSISTLVIILNLLDQVIQHCYPDAEQESISQSLLTQTQDINKLQNNQSTDSLESYPNINGFTFSIETERTEKPLKRKRALANSPNGVTVLKGEWSFSSIDRILVDELIFYIQQNDLKAN